MRQALQLLVTVALAAGVAVPAAAAPARHTTTPDQWLARSMAAANAASSVRVVASGIPNGASTIGFDFRLVAGKGGAGTLTLGKDTIDLVRVGRVAYFRAGAAFWRKYGGKPAAQLFAGRWVKMPATNSDFKAFTELTDIPKFFTGILSSHGTLKLGGTRVINGTKAVGLVDTSKSGGGTLWVAASGKPYPLALMPPSGPGQVLFESWNTPMRVAAPRAFIDFSKLKK